MFSKEERQIWNIEFWGLFKKLMRKHMSSNGKRINWLKYPTEIKHIFLRLETNSNEISLNFDIQFKDAEIRELIWEQMLELKGLMNSMINQNAIWIKDLDTETNRTISRISWKKEGLNYYQKDEWPEIHLFFKTVLIEFDRFYQEFKDVLLNLVE